MKSLKSAADQLHTKELEIPETLFIRDIEDRVFQGIVLQCLAEIPDIALLEGNFIDHILGRDNLEGLRSIHIEQNSSQHSVSIRIEVNVAYGVAIPEKAKQIQEEITEKIAKLTGLHVASVHVVFKNIISESQLKKDILRHSTETSSSLLSEEEYNDTF